MEDDEWVERVLLTFLLLRKVELDRRVSWSSSSSEVAKVNRSGALLRFWRGGATRRLTCDLKLCRVESLVGLLKCFFGAVLDRLKEERFLGLCAYLEKAKC